MLTSTTRAVQFGSLLLVSAAIVYVGVTGKITTGSSQANLEAENSGQAEVLYIPKVGRVIRHADQATEGMQVADSGAGSQANRSQNQVKDTVQRASGEGCVILPKVGTRC
jgi:hypothetical protein